MHRFLPQFTTDAEEVRDFNCFRCALLAVQESTEKNFPWLKDIVQEDAPTTAEGATAAEQPEVAPRLEPDAPVDERLDTLVECVSVIKVATAIEVRVTALFHSESISQKYQRKRVLDAALNKSGSGSEREFTHRGTSIQLESNKVMGN